MDSNSNKSQSIQSCILTVQVVAIKPKSQMQTQAYPQYGIKIQNQYESLTKFLALAYSLIAKSNPLLVPQRTQTPQLQTLSNTQSLLSYYSKSKIELITFIRFHEL